MNQQQIDKYEENKARSYFSFADKVIKVENIGLDNSNPGVSDKYEKLRVTYIYKGKEQTSIMSAW